MRELQSRLLQLLFTILGIFTLLFFLLRVTGDPAAILLGSNATTENIAQLNEQMGFDQPLLEQYLIALRGLLVLDFGDSIRSGQEALPEAFGRLGVSLQLVGLALAFAMVIAIPIGVHAASNRRAISARLMMGAAYVTQATPVYISGVLLILLVAQSQGFLPTFGWSSPRHMVLPVFALSFVAMAKFARLTRASMHESLNEDYIRTARAKGLSPRRVLVVHALRNSLIPVVTVLGAELGSLVGAAVITETLFSVPGIGQMLVTAALSRDYALVQAGAFLVAIVVVLVNVAVDMIYEILNPRIREARTR